MTHITLAIFDPSHRSPDGGYWRWRHPELSAAELDRLYYEIVRRRIPPDPAIISDEQLWCGAVRFSPDLCLLYRVFDGGRDDRGRPGRFLIVALRSNTDDILWSPCGVLSHVAVELAAAKARQFDRMHPDLEFSIEPARSHNDDAATTGNEWRGVGALEKAFHALLACQEYPVEIFVRSSSEEEWGVMEPVPTRPSREVVSDAPPPTSVTPTYPIPKQDYRVLAIIAVALISLTLFLVRSRKTQPDPPVPSNATEPAQTPKHQGLLRPEGGPHTGASRICPVQDGKITRPLVPPSGSLDSPVPSGPPNRGSNKNRHPDDRGDEQGTDREPKSVR